MKTPTLILSLLVAIFAGCDSIDSAPISPAANVQFCSESTRGGSYNVTGTEADYVMMGSAYQVFSCPGPDYWIDADAYSPSSDSNIFWHFMKVRIYADGQLVKTYSHNYQDSDERFDIDPGDHVYFHAGIGNGASIDIRPHISGANEVKVRIYHETEGPYVQLTKEYVFDNYGVTY